MQPHVSFFLTRCKPSANLAKAKFRIPNSKSAKAEHLPFGSDSKICDLNKFATEKLINLKDLFSCVLLIM